jgi:hypothetical protein
MNTLGHTHPGVVEPGETCPTCHRRVNHKKQSDSPKSAVKSFRIPYTDDQEKARFNEDLAHAALVVGITSAHKYPIFKFLDWLIDEILSDQERWQNAYHADHGVGA